ncbi:EamA family transporter [Ramlibacter sp. H39-3-26]|uniref:EamA family transporter n=1 Tax=Curvibacter soli TaxID=3031331 RepID=UPI0023DC67C1|nr:EamA family transporter [Ramlibacter sp. H39-3-26]MDF1485092.1 EamA family transporter [Ramlibacter sp. H39-3-26]
MHACTAALAWVWIPIVVWAAFAQTVRNAAQRSLTREAGTLSATLARFLYGLPCAAAWLLAVWGGQGGGALPGLAPGYLGWLALGAVSQLGATAALLRAMQERNFIVAITWSKTEVLQVALFSALFLGEPPGPWQMAAMAVAVAGVALLSRPASGGAAPQGPAGRAAAQRCAGRAAAQRCAGRAAAWGLASGALFALSAVGFRGAALRLGPEVSPWLAGAWGVLWAQALQSLLLGGYLALRDPVGLAATGRAWRLSLVAGSMGALASIGWFTAMALRPAADVRTLGMVEVLFSYAVSRRLFGEKLAARERWGLLLVAAGLVGVCAAL